MIQFIRSLCILVWCLQSISGSLRPWATNATTHRTINIPLPKVTGDTEQSTTRLPLTSSTRKPISIVDTLIVHLINSQPSLSSASHQFESNLKTNLQHANNSFFTSHIASPALSCADGQTYWDPLEGQCVKCTSSCPASAYISRVCNRTHDLECQCHKGSYMSVVDKTCKPCAECPFGWGVWRTCRWSRNTVCRKCQPGTYSGASVGTLGCIPCSKCGPRQEVIAECDGNRDTVCVDRAALRANFSQYFPELAERSEISSSLIINSDDLIEDDIAVQNRVSSFPEPTIYTSKFSAHHNALPLYFAILVVIVFGLCIYALIQLRCTEVIHGRSSLATQADHKQQLMLGNPGTAVMIPQVVTTIASPYYQSSESLPAHSHPGVWSRRLGEHLQPHQPYNTVMHLYTSQRFKAPGKAEMSELDIARNGNNGSSKPRPKYKAYYELLYAPNEAPLTSSSGFQELASEVVESLERRLAKDTISWRMLARQLGYDDEQMAEFETKSTETTTTDKAAISSEPVVDTVNVIRLLLADWCHRENGSTRQSEQSESAQNHKWPVAALVKALTRIGRVDCARLVQQWSQHKPSTPSTSTSSCASSSSQAT